MKQAYKTIILSQAPDSLEIFLELSKQAPVDFEILDQVDNYPEGYILIKTLKPDIVLLDMSMSEIDESKTLKLRESFSGRLVCFGNGYHTAIVSFRNGAFDFLESPVTQSEFNAVVGRIWNQQHGTDPEPEEIHEIAEYKSRILINRHDKAVVIPVEDIIYIQAFGAYCTIFYTNGRTLDASRPILYFQAQLNPNVFFRVHRSYLVNIHHIHEVRKKEANGFLYLSDGNKIELSKPHTHKLLNILAEDTKDR